MAVEYDLVVIGSTTAALKAAIAAANLRARVALVSPLPFEAQHFWAYQTLLTLGRQQLYPWQTPTPKFIWEQGQQWAQTVIANLAERHSAAVLASQGVEVILATGEFQARPELHFAVDGRRLRSRSYLIATAAKPVCPGIKGLQASGFLTAADVLAQLAAPHAQWPQELIVLGSGPTAIELSQTLARLGSQVTLMTENVRILPREEPEVVQWVQAQLEAEGVRLLTQAQIEEVRQQPQTKQVITTAQILETKEILLASAGAIAVPDLNLEAVAVQFTPQGIVTNARLQTTNPRIYACGDVIGGYPLAHVADYEAKIVVKNALSYPRHQVNYRCIPWAILSDPALARVGLTELQARRYGGEVIVLKQFYKHLEQVQLTGAATGMSKLITQRNGEILGAHFVGPGAAETIHQIALAMKQRLKVKALSDLSYISPTFSEINLQTASQWEQRRQQNFGDNLRENWFSFMRSR